MDIEKAWTVFMEDNQKFFEALGSRIAGRRKELHLTQEELGQTLKVTQQEIASYEKGNGGFQFLAYRSLPKPFR